MVLKFKLGRDIIEFWVKTIGNKIWFKKNPWTVFQYLISLNFEETAFHIHLKRLSLLNGYWYEYGYDMDTNTSTNIISKM